MTTSIGGRPPILVPMPPVGSSPEMMVYGQQMKAALEAILNILATPAQTYVVQNNTGANIVRTIDCGAAVLATTTNVLATLLTDLQNKGVVRRNDR